MKLRPHLLLLSIILIAALLRLVLLGEIPAILNRDEAALGYNAYLLLETGRDEWGTVWPLFLKSFGDYKLLGYSLSIIPAMALFGMEDWVVRLPSAGAGIGLVYLSFAFAKQQGLKPWQALLFAAMIAVQPVFTFYSRVGYEANVALSLLVASLFCFFKRKASYDFLGLGLLFMATNTYNTPLLLLPFLLLLPVLDRGVLYPRKWFVPVIGMIIIGVVMASQLIPLTQQKGNITLLSDETTWMQWIEYRQGLTSWQQQTLGNRYVFVSTLVLNRIVASFSPSFLVLQGGTHPWHSLPGWGHVLGSVYVLFVLGMFAFFAELSLKVITVKHFNELKLIISKFRKELLLVYLLLAALIPSVITVDAPHATRSLLFFWLLVFFSVLGAGKVVAIAQKQKYTLFASFFGALLLLTGVWQTGKYLYEYFTWSHSQQGAWKPGIQALTRELEARPESAVAWIDKEGYDYILAAWYLKIRPEVFFDTVVRQQPNSFGFQYGERVGRIHFIANESDRVSEESILVYWDTTLNQWQVRTQ